MSSSDAITFYGLTALPASITATKPSTTSPAPVPISSLKIPSSPLAHRINEYTKSLLPPATYRHSLRVYSYGLAIARQCFPSWNVAPESTLEETWFLTAMLHDIGTTDENMQNTMLSYDFFAGVHVLDLLKNIIVGEGTEQRNAQVPRAQAESVAEAIMRHQDVQDQGMVTLMTRLVHLGTLLDNIGANGYMVDRETIEAVVEAYPRKEWSGCFRNTVVNEKRLKPWAMVSRIERFEEKIMENEVMGRYD